MLEKFIWSTGMVSLVVIWEALLALRSPALSVQVVWRNWPVKAQRDWVVEALKLPIAWELPLSEKNPTATEIPMRSEITPMGTRRWLDVRMRSLPLGGARPLGQASFKF